LEAEIQKVDATIQEKNQRSRQAEAEVEARRQTTEAVEAERRAAWLNYKYAWLSERAVTQTDLEGQSASELATMRNSIYAKYGFVFVNPEVQAIFSNESWYAPISSNSDVDSLLSSLERNNAITIRDFEKKIGYLRSCTFLNSPPSNEFGANRRNPLKWVESLSAKFFSPLQRTSLR